jgi:PII-like signaling protein
MSLFERGQWPLALANAFSSKLFCLSAALGAWHWRGCCKMTSAVEGFLGRHVVETAHLVDAGGKLPVMIIFGDTDEHVNRGVPVLKEMATHRLIVRENVVLEQGNLD